MHPLIDFAVFTRDRHPEDHCSFASQGGPWPPHCIDGTSGFQIHRDLPQRPEFLLIDKGALRDRDAYSGFEGTSLEADLKARRIARLVIGGLATDYCVRATVLDARRLGWETWLLTDAIAAVDATPGEGGRALLAMRDADANLTDSGQITTIIGSHAARTALLVVDVQNDFCEGGALAAPHAERVIAPLRRLLELVRT